jgi:hypothetical protein
MRDRFEHYYAPVDALVASAAPSPAENVT